MNLLVLNPETKLPEPSPEALLIPTFKKIWTRKNRIDGDRDGSRKVVNLYEIGWIYYTGHFNSRFRHMEDSEEKIRELLKIPIEWKPDEEVIEGLKIFIDSQFTPSLDYLQTLEGTNVDLKLWIKAKRALIKVGNLTAKEVGEILDVIDRAPATLESIQKAKEIVFREQSAAGTGRKGRSLNKFEIPKGM